jgi:hypothetical protein
LRSAGYDEAEIDALIRIGVAAAAPQVAARADKEGSQ